MKRNWRRAAPSKGPQDIIVHCPEVRQVSTAFTAQADFMLTLPGREKLEVGKILPRGSVLAGEDGANTVKSFLVDVEVAIARVLSGHDAMRLMAAQRRIARAVDNDGSRYLGWVNGRRTAELAILKYAQSTALLDHTGRDLVTWTFTEDELRAIARLRSLAILYYDLTGMYRRIGKGMSLRISRSWPLKAVAADETSRKIDRLIERWEDRTHAHRVSLTELLGQHREVTPSVPPECILVASWRNSGDDEPVTVSPFTLDGCDVSFDVMAHPSGSEVIADFGHLDAVFHAKYGVPLQVLFEALRVVSLPALVHIRDGHVEADGAVYSVITLYRRGYILGAWPSEGELRYRLELLAQMRGSRAHELEAVWRALTISTIDPAAISLHERGPAAPIYRLGSRYLYDAFSAGQFLIHLLRDLRAEDAVQRKADLRLEDQIHAELARFGQQPFVSGKPMKVNGTVLTDLDASVVRYGVLIMVDAYSSAKTTALDQGDYRATRNRATGLIKKVDAWLRKAYVMAQAGRGDNFDLSDHGITHILPVVVTAAVEWLPDDSAKLWLTDETPRVVSLGELIKYVERLGPVALRAVSIPVARPQ